MSFSYQHTFSTGCLLSFRALSLRISEKEKGESEHSYVGICCEFFKVRSQEQWKNNQLV